MMVIIWYITGVCEVLLFFFSNFLKIPAVSCNKHMHITVHFTHKFTITYAYAFYACFVSCQDVEVKESKQVQRPTVTTVMETPSSMGDGGDQV